MTKIVITTTKEWNIRNARILKKRYKNTTIISSPKKITYNFLKKLTPQYVFFPHWSWIIPNNIQADFNCIGFHMTSLPYGRGGSPLQNLIISGKTKTKISAFKITNKLDAGPIYLKKELSLKGSAEEIYNKMSKIIFTDMIPYIVKHGLKPRKQKGNTTYFKRRTPEQGNLKNCRTLKQVYDHVRMLDAPGYPQAFLNVNKLRFKFHNAKLKNKILSVQVKIERRK